MGTTGITDINIGEAARGDLAQKGATKTYNVTVGDKLIVTLKGPEGEDFDLYLKRGSEPTVDDYDLKGFTNSANENVVFHLVQSGDYYIMVHSYRGSGNFEVKVELV
ncbi:MAG: PPC domain-containing protein [Candidatus Brocadiales bacterium]